MTNDLQGQRLQGCKDLQGQDNFFHVARQIDRALVS